MFTVDSHVEGEWRTTRVRILQTYWGMAVTLTARATTAAHVDDGLVRITPGLALDVAAAGLLEPEVQALARGLRLMSRAFPSVPGAAVTAIEIRDLTWPASDYQPDVTAIAMAHWTAAHLDVDAPSFEVVYDRATDRYWVSP